MGKLSLLIETNNDDGVQTLGVMYVVNERNEIQYRCVTLELPWKDNLKKVSCIPAESYKVIKHISPRFGKCFWVKDVSGRSEILIHYGAFHKNTLGCILVGDDFKDVNKDWRLDVTNSKKTLEKLLKIMPSEFELKIVRF